MKQETKLYISDKLVDFSTELSIPFTYQLKDINNPSIVKNPFTKTIDIIGTPNNNKIFGEIYNFNREQLYDATNLVGAYFNPSIRTPFSIFRNGEIIESGYMQLNTITIKNKDIHYNITLYGGIGNFFYSLMYNENSEPLTLADLVYGVEDEQTGLPFEDSDREFDFTINKEFVYSCFNNVGKDNNNTINDYITFVPSYNGLPENFDSDKVLINVAKNSYWSGETSKKDGDKTYTAYNSYVLAQLPRKYNEWEILDLRSYLQRPAIKMSKIIDACCNPINNGGYSVELDSNFFNDDNPYYKDAWVALPLLNNEEKEKNNITTTEGILFDTNFWVGKKNTTTGIIDMTKVIPTNGFDVNGDTILYSKTPVGTLTNISVDFNLSFTTDNLDNDNLYLSNMVYEFSKEYGAWTHYRHHTAIAFQILAYDVNGKIIGSSDISLFTYYDNSWLGEITKSNYNFYLKNFTPVTNAPFNIISGIFEKNGDKYVFKKGDNESFRLELNNIPYSEQIKLELRLQRILENPPFDINTIFDYGVLSPAIFVNSREKFNETKVTGYFQPIITNCSISRDEPDNVITTGSLITKDMLLKTEKTPADYLLSYTKV